MKTALTFLMVFAMLFLSAACGKAGDKNETSVSDPAPGSAAMTDANAETEAPETEAKLLPDIPDKTYDGQSLRFLSRESVAFPAAPRGYLLLTYAGLGLGFVKNLGTRTNSLLPPARRIRVQSSMK